MAKKKSKKAMDSLVGGSLLVPMALDAIRVDSKGNYSSINQQKSVPAKFGNTVADFTKIGTYAGLGGEVVSTLFDNGQKPKPGIHLHWTIPKAIANSTPDGKGGLKHFNAPDRWFILRYNVEASSKKILSKAWVVLSNSTQDFTDTTNGKTAWPVYPSNPSGAKQILVGEQLDYVSTNTPTPSNPIELLGVGPGDPTMIANHLASKSIFGLYDDLSDYSTNTPVEFSYMVIGWYDNPKKDILYIDPTKVNLASTPKVTMSDLWVDLMNSLDWNWQPDAKAEQLGSNFKRILPSPLPNISIYQGLLYGVQWEGPNPTNGYASGAPDNDASINLSMGRTSVEALSALIANDFAGGGNSQKDIEEILEALQYSFLDKYNTTDGPAEVEATNHQNGYGVKKGGLTWDIRPKKASKLIPLNGDDQQKLPPVPAYFGQELGALNLQQELVNQLQQELIATQQLLYTSWYKKNLAYFEDQPNPASYTDELNTIKSKLTTLSGTTLPKAVKKLGALKFALTSTMTSKLKEYELHEIFLDRFWEPRDPVIMLNGLTRPKKYGDGSSLFCRSQVMYPPLTGITFTDDGPQKTVTADQLATSWTLPIASWLPPEVKPLILESFLLAATNEMATLIANEAGIDNPSQQILTIINNIQNGSTDPNDSNKLIGQRPAAIADIVWEQAWNPLFLQWEMQWHSSYTAPDANNPFSKNVISEGWNFLKGDDGMDYSWKQSIIPSNFTTYKGQTVLGAHASFNLAAQLQKYISQQKIQGNIKEDDSKYSFLELILKAIVKWDLLSQKLTGLTNQLVLSDPNLILPLYNTDTFTLDSSIIKMINNTQEHIPQPGDANSFLPIMAGHLKISKLSVIDTFGQVQQIMDINNNIGSAITPIFSNHLITAGQKEYAQFPPRLTQPARIKFRWLAAEDNTNPPISTNSVNSTSPVCGWFVPNHLDGSLMVFNAKGGSQGSIQFIAGGAGSNNSGLTGLRWNTVPGSNAPLGAVPQLKNIHLQGFVTALLENGLENNSDGSLQELFNYFNESLEQVDPTGHRRSNNLSVLIGEPLALVRAEIAMEVEGTILNDPSFKVVNKFETYNYEDVTFEAALGASNLETDSLLGFFTGIPTTDQPAAIFKQMSLPYGQKIPRNSPSYFKANETIPLTINKTAEPTALTLVTRPHGTIYIRSGHLPVKKVVVPQDGIVEALAAMELSFFIGPVLANSQQLSIPLPSDVPGTWSWEMQEEVTKWQTVDKITAPNVKGHFFSQPLQINEGFLNLSNALGNPLSILYFQVQNGQYLVKPNSPPLKLTWQVQGAKSIRLQGGSINQICKTPPLPTSASVTITATTIYTLTITDADGKTVSKTLTINLIK